MAAPLLVLVRHGESAWNAGQRLQGQADAPLSELGREQARALAPVLARLPPAAAVTSDLSRASRTAELAGRDDAEPDQRWRERAMGDWTGRFEAEVPAHRLREFRAGDLVPPGGEPWEAVQARVGAAVDDLAARGGCWVAFTHGGPVRAAVAHVTGADARTIAGPSNASLTLLELGRRPRLLAFNWSTGGAGVPRASEPGGAEIAVSGATVTNGGGAGGAS